MPVMLAILQCHVIPHFTHTKKELVEYMMGQKQNWLVSITNMLHEILKCFEIIIKGAET